MFDLVNLVKTAGYLGVAGIVFAESGLLVGLILPGDSLLFTAGFLASQGYLNIVALCLVAFVSAVVGDNVGYYLGNRFGHSVFRKKDSLLLSPDHITRAEKYFERWGAKTIIIARFIPVVRTIAPTLAGVGSMRWSVFALNNIIGGILWAIGLPVLGYALGSSIPNIDAYLLPIVGGIILISVAPGIIHLLREPESRAHLMRGLHHMMRWDR